MNVEDIIREVLSKTCSLHGEHPDIKISKEWKLNISACCHEFHEQMENIIKDFHRKAEFTSLDIA